MQGDAAADGCPPKKTPKRATLTIDLGPLRQAVDTRAATDGVKPADVVRSALRSHLGEQPVPVNVQPLGENDADAYRPSMTSADAAALDHLMALTGARSRLIVLRSLIQGAPLFAAATVPGAGANFATAVQSLITSNHQLVGLARNLNQIARSLHVVPGKTTGADRLVLQASAGVVREHLELASRLVADLRPLVKLVGEAERKKTRPRKAKAQGAAAQIAEVLE